MPIRPAATMAEAEGAITPLKMGETRIQVSKDIEVEFTDRISPIEERSASETRSDIELRRMDA